MKRFTAGLLNRTKSSDSTPLDIDSPEANAARAIRLFCESGSPNNAGEEVLHLPVIVEAAESSPQAAASSAYTIRKLLSRDHYSRPHVQYNAIMLVRILSENPGPSFTRNIDSKFVSSVKTLLKESKDPSVQQLLRETLDFLEVNRIQDEGLAILMGMWRQQKGAGSRLQLPRTANAPQNFRVPPFDPNAPPVPPSQSHPNQREFGRSQLPSPAELASRVEESKNTAKILLQLVQSTPPEEVMSNDLIKEFAERCQSAQRSMQGFINCDSPPPDDDTLQTLIEVNEQLSLALSRHQRAILSARRAMGASPSPVPPADGRFSQPPSQQNAYAQPERPLSNKSPTFTSPVSPEYGQDTTSYHAPQGPPYSMTDRLQSRAHPYNQRPTSSTLPPISRDADHSLNPFSDSSEATDYASHPMEPVNYGLPLPPSRDATSPPRHGSGAYYNGPTPSYMGRQASAANGLTMHGADSGTDLVEMDSESREGRLGDHGSSEASPVDTRQPVVYRY